MGTGKARVWRTTSEKRRIVELTLEPGMSVSRVAQAEGVNAHQVFDWRRAYRDGRLNDPGTALLPVVIAEAAKRDEPVSEDADCLSASGSIHIEIPERATISVEPGADKALLRTVLELLRK
jgi:transposase